MSAFFDNPEVAKIYNTYVNSFANGTVEGNKVFADYIKSGNLELVKEALKKDPEWFRTVNKTDLLNELRKDERLAEIFNKWLVMESFHSEYDFEDRLLSEDYEVTGSPGRRAVELSGGRAGVVLSKAFGKDLEHLYNKFFVRERVRPKVPYAGSARLAPLPDDMLHLEDINKFYLGRDLASMKIVGMNEKLQQEEMTLAKQWNLYKRLAQKTELTDLEKEKLNAYKEVLSTVVTRVPIPDASGILNLEFGGFLPKKGGGLYIARSVMNELAGADYDIDSAFFYFGIPKEYREWVKGKRGAIPEYDKVMGRHGAEEIHFSKDRRGETYAHEFAGMFDPYTLVQSNLISSAGRSENLARSVVFVRRLNSLLLQLKVAGIKLDTGNLLLVPVDEGDRIRAEATKFGVIGASADAAKGGKTEKGTVLDFISMRRNIILSNFKEIRTKGG